MLLGSCLCPTQRHVSRKARSLLFSAHNNLKTKHTSQLLNAASCRSLSYYKQSNLNTKYSSSQHTLPSCTPRLHRGLSTCRATYSMATRSLIPLADEEEKVENDMDDERVIAHDTMLQRIDGSPVDILALIENAEKEKKQLEVKDRKNNNNSDEKWQSNVRSRRRQTTTAANDRLHCSIVDLETMAHTYQFSQALEVLCRTYRLAYYPTNIRHGLYSKIAQLDAPDIVQLVRPWAIQHVSDNTRVWRVIKEASEFWDHDKMMKMFQYCCESSNGQNERLQLHLFTRFLMDYRCHKMDMNNLLQMIPEMNSIAIKLFNMAMNVSLRQERMEDVEFLLCEMQTRKVDMDAASFNILIRSKLQQGKKGVDNAKSIYNEMQSRNVDPTMATFNTFIDYSCRYLLWDDLEMWMDRMKEKAMHGNLITSRILLNAMLTQRYQPRIAKAFERVASVVPMPANEETLNPIIAILLRHKRTLTALSLLDKIFLRSNKTLSSPLPPPTIYAYNLLIHGLSQKGDLEAGHQILDAMASKEDHRIPQPDIVSYTTLIHGYIRKAESQDIDIDAIIRLYQQLCASGLKSNDKLQTVLLHGIIKSRHIEIDKARRLFDMMIAEDDKKGRSSGDYDGDDDERLNQTIAYNLMMDGYFLHTYHRNQRYGLTTSSIEPQRILLDDAIQKKLKLTTSSLNIWIRGVVIFNKDLYAAEALIQQFKRLAIRPNERTTWYLCRTAYLKGRYDMARRWIQEYEMQGRIIRGRGLSELKKQLRI